MGVGLSFMSKARPQRTPKSPVINLSVWETNIFRFLRRAAAVTSVDEPVHLRVAGGWVRDKLLGRATGDIDIAVQNSTGFRFASKVHSFALKKAVEFSCEESAHDHLSTHGFKLPVYGCKEYVPDVSKVTVIAPNPSMSRHLETATLRLDGYDLDFVQLRTEDYAMSASHRIPHSISTGTPEQDADRRDFTVNALFYNLQTQKVEDFTGHGLRDLSDAVLRTPLDPNTTLLEDPLRALRAIRFACRLQFDLHSSLCRALSAKEVRENLRRKVSRERIGSEVNQIVDSPDVVRGFRMIAKYNLIGAVFLNNFTSTTVTEELTFLRGVRRVQKGLEVLEQNADVLSEAEWREFRNYGQEVLIYALLLPDKTRICTLLSDALRQTKRLQQDIRNVLVWSHGIEELIGKWVIALDTDPTSLREKELWVRIAETVHAAGPELWLVVIITCSVKLEEDALLRTLKKSGVSAELCGVVPAMNGNKLQRELGIRPGPEVGKALRELLRLQLLNNRTRDLRRADVDGESSIRSPDVCVELLKERLSSAEVAL